MSDAPLKKKISITLTTPLPTQSSPRTQTHAYTSASLSKGGAQHPTRSSTRSTRSSSPGSDLRTHSHPSRRAHEGRTRLSRASDAAGSSHFRGKVVKTPALSNRRAPNGCSSHHASNSALDHGVHRNGELLNRPPDQAPSKENHMRRSRSRSPARIVLEGSDDNNGHARPSAIALNIQQSSISMSHEDSKAQDFDPEKYNDRTSGAGGTSALEGRAADNQENSVAENEDEKEPNLYDDDDDEPMSMNDTNYGEYDHQGGEGGNVDEDEDEPMVDIYGDLAVDDDNADERDYSYDGERSNPDDSSNWGQEDEKTNYDAAGDDNDNVDDGNTLLSPREHHRKKRQRLHSIPVVELNSSSPVRRRSDDDEDADVRDDEDADVRDDASVDSRTTGKLIDCFYSEALR